MWTTSQIEVTFLCRASTWCAMRISKSKNTEHSSSKICSRQRLEQVENGTITCMWHVYQINNTTLCQSHGFFTTSYSIRRRTLWTQSYVNFWRVRKQSLEYVRKAIEDCKVGVEHLTVQKFELNTLRVSTDSRVISHPPTVTQTTSITETS